MKKRFITHMTMLACAFVLGLLMLPSVSVKAATPAVINIPTGEGEGCGISKYDINGDGTADTLKVYDTYCEGDDTAYYDYHGHVELNGKVIDTFGVDEEFSGYSAKLIILKNGKKYLFLDCNHSEYTHVNILYEYSDGYLNQVLDLNNVVGSKYGNELYILSVKVSGNTITFYDRYDSGTFGESILKYQYTYKSGKLKKASSYGWVTRITQEKSGKTYNSNILVTKKAIKAYKTATSSKKYATIKKGKKVKVVRYYYSSKYGMRIRVKYQGRYMWIKNGCFKYIHHVE